MRVDRAARRASLAGLGILGFAAPAAGLEIEDGAIRVPGSGWPALTVEAPYRALLPAEAGPVAALRFDGNSTFAETAGPVVVEPREGLAISAVVALASPPVEPASVLHVAADADAPALRLSVGPWRRPELIVGDLRAAGVEPLPLGRLVRLDGRIDAEGVRLYVDGRLVATSDGAPPERIEGEAAVGRTRFSGARDVHPYGVWNGLIGDLSVVAGDLAQAPEPAAAPSLDVDLAPPEEWFAQDRLRPRVHPMPPAGWTNEPHALVRDGDVWRLYHQANPNGAFWDHIVWGHLVSTDLATWQAEGPALVPTTGFDRRGIWVGNWIPDTDPPAVLYTGVDGGRAGLGRATREADGSLVADAGAIATDTPPGYQDMRDPYIVPTADGWLALVGAGLPDGSRAVILAYASQDTHDWRFLGEFDTGGAAMPGEYWELPVLRRFGDRWLLMGTPVIRDEEARTLYWTGSFDGVRFTPDRADGNVHGLFGTMLAPTLAEDETGRTVAIGVVPDGGQRPEPVRRAAGWVHALSLPFETAACGDDPTRICTRIAPSVLDGFDEPVTRDGEGALSETPEHIDLGPEPVLVRVRVSAPAGGEAVIGLRATPDGEETTLMRLRPADGSVELDRSASSLEPWSADDVRDAEFGPGVSEVEATIVVDGAALGGTVGARPFGVLVYPTREDATGLTLSGTGGARLLDLEVRRWRPD